MSQKTKVQIQFEKLLPRLSEVFASANINFLIGSGCSKPFLPTLENIEKRINDAIKNGETTKQIEGYKEYFEKVMLPNKNILEFDTCEKTEPEKCTEHFNFIESVKSYKSFLKILTQLILDRKTTVVGKQVNIFTTNIDILFETVFEDLELHYNDGFIGKMNPIFDLSNFKQSIIQRSQHFNNRSEIPVFNLLKIHGSVNWKYKERELSCPDRKIYLSSDLSHLDISIFPKDTEEEQEAQTKTIIDTYKEKILVVNPEDAKFSETVLNKYYYELLRSYSSELERENSVLFVMGFSMADQHIREITKRAARSNPTLQIYIFVHSKEQAAEMNKLMEVTNNQNKYPNIEILAPKYDEPKEKYNFNLETITKEVFEKINLSKKSDLEKLTEEIKKANPNNSSKNE